MCRVRRVEIKSLGEPLGGGPEGGAGRCGGILGKGEGELGHAVVEVVLEGKGGGGRITGGSMMILEN